MEYRDYFQRHIDQLGKVLAAVLAKMSGIGQGNAALSIEEIKQELKSETKVDLDHLLNLSDSDIIPYLTDELKYSDSSFENLAELILICFVEQDRKRALQVVLILLNHIQQNSTDFSFELGQKIESVKNELSTY